MTPKERILTAAAYHEAGHAVAALLLGDDVLDVRLNTNARNVAEIDGRVTRRNPLHAPSERLMVEHTDADAAAFKRAFETNLVVAFAGQEAQRRHDPKSMRGYRLRDDMVDIDDMLDGVEPQSARQTYRHWVKREAG